MIGIYYIATNEYITLFNDFFNSLNNFIPNQKKLIYLLTDSKQNFELKSTDNVIIKQYNITHYPWPIITLYKMWLCNMFKMPTDITHCFYFNANSIITDILDFNLENKMYFTYHLCHDLVPGKHLQAGFFGGEYSKFYKFCKLHILKVKDYTKRKVIPPGDDETILNDIVYNILKQDEYIIFNIFYKNNMKPKKIKLQNKYEINKKKY